MKMNLRYFVLYLVLLFSLSSLKGQNQPDSLLKQLEKTKDRRERAELLLRIANNYIERSPEKSYSYLNEALPIIRRSQDEKLQLEAFKLQSCYYWTKADSENLARYNDSIYQLSKAMNDIKGIGTYNYLQGLYWIDRDSLKKAKDYLTRSKVIFESENYVEGIADSYFRLGVINWRKHSYDSALFYYSLALQNFSNSGDKYNVAKTHRYKGIVNKRKGDYPDALQEYYESVKIYESLGEEKMIAEVLGNIGSLHLELENYARALQSYSRSLDIFKRLGHKRFTGYRLHSIGNVYFEIDSLDKANIFYKDALEIYKEHNFTIGIGEVKTDIAILYYRLGRYKESISLLDEAKQIFQDKDYVNGLTIVYRHLTKNYVALENFRKALTIANEALDMLDRTKNPEQLRNMYQVISMIYAELNNYEKAYKFYKKYHLLSDSILNLTSKERIAEIQTKYETAKREKEIENLITEKKLDSQRFQRNFFIVVFFLLLIVAILIFTSYQANKKHMKELQEKNRELEKAKNKAIEADKLKSSFLASMSHEIRTPMNAIVGFSELIGEQDYNDEQREEIIEQIKRNSSILLNLINDLIDIAKIESGELTIEKKQVDLNKMLDRVGDFFKKNNRELLTNIDFAVEKPKNQITIITDPNRLNQILYNLLDNAFKFTEKGHIKVSAQIYRGSNNKGQLHFIVEDTGLGIPKEQQEEIFKRFSKFKQSKTKYYRGTGLGLAITKNLVKKLGGNIRVKSEVEKGSVFYVDLPVTYYINHS